MDSMPFYSVTNLFKEENKKSGSNALGMSIGRFHKKKKGKIVSVINCRHYVSLKKVFLYVVIES